MDQKCDLSDECGSLMGTANIDKMTTATTLLEKDKYATHFFNRL